MKPVLLFQKLILTTLAGATLLATGTGCRRADATRAGPRIATTTSYLEAATRDLLGDDLQVIRLAEPGTCPGHFDIRPSQVSELRRCQALLRFDFQRSLDQKLAGDEHDGPQVAEIAIVGGMCRPDSYLTACQQTADHLVSLDQLSQAAADERLSAIAARLDTMSGEVTNRVADARLVGLPVIASGHQRDFCEWLGLKVVAAFRAADTASIGEIEEAIDAGELAQVQLVVANLPEGRRTADALAERLRARVVLFENFPAEQHGSISFDAMVRNNVRALLQAAAP